MFEQCSHGYVALTCPSCKGRPVAAAFAPQAAAVQAPRGNGKHYSGATFEARVELAGMWDDIMARAADQVSRTQLRQGIQDGALVRRPVEVED